MVREENVTVLGQRVPLWYLFVTCRSCCSVRAPSLFLFQVFGLLLGLFLLVICLFYGTPPLLPCNVVKVVIAEWQRGFVQSCISVKTSNPYATRG